jgi:hypothetical protein
LFATTLPPGAAMQWASLGTASTEIGPSAKTKEGIFVEPSATRFSAEASARKTTWHLHPTGNAAKAANHKRGKGGYASGAGAGSNGYGGKQRPSEGAGSGNWEGHKTVSGHTIRPSSRDGPIALAGGSPIQRAQAQSRQKRAGHDNPSPSAAPLSDDDAYDRELEMQGQVGPGCRAIRRRCSATLPQTEVDQSNLCSLRYWLIRDTTTRRASITWPSPRVYEFRKRKAATEARKLPLAEAYAVSRLEALIKFMELGREWHILLTTSQVAYFTQKRGLLVRWMTCRAISARP